MDSSLLNIIHSALLDTDLLLKHSSLHGQRKICKILTFRLRNLKAFALLSAGVLGNDASLVSLLLRVEDIVRRNSEEIHTLCLHGDFGNTALDKASEFQNQIQSFTNETKEWFVSLSDFARRQSTYLTPNELSKVICCMLENIQDFIPLMPGHLTYIKVSLKDLEEQMTFLNCLVCFALQRTQDFLVHIVEVVFTAASLLFTYGDYFQSDKETRERLDSEILWIGQKMKNHQHQLYTTYNQALSSSKFLRPSLSPTHQGMNDDNCFIAIKNCLSYIINNLWEYLRLNTDPVISVKSQLQELFEVLRSFRNTIFKQQCLNNITKDIGALVCDTGVLIYLLYRINTELDVGLLQDLLEMIKTILAEVGDKDPQLPGFNFTMTSQLGDVDFVIQKLMELRSHEAESTTISQRVQTIEEELVSFRSFLGNIVDSHRQQEELQSLWYRVFEMTYKVEELIDLLVIGDIPDSFSTSFDSIMKDFSNIRAQIEVTREIKVNEPSKGYTYVVLAQTRPSTRANEIVGFVDEAKSIIDKLTRGTGQLKILAIVGMPGLGKTTLAATVYKDPYIVGHFHVCAWSTISQVVDRRNLLHGLLNQVDANKCWDEMTESDVVENLWRSLKGRRYLIVLDDIWDIEAWTGLRESFPDDYTQSRILLTSRHHDVVHSEMLLNQKPHFLRQLDMQESLKLLQIKLFPGDNGWPPHFLDLGMQIAKSCNGLPLTIIIVAGLLVNTKPEGWKEILDDLSLGDMSITDHCLKTLERSYEHLPYDLRPCLLYFSAFLEDEEVSVRRLLHLWTAEGFIRKAEGKSIEDVAEDYLKDLIGRSLIMVAKQRWNNGVKTCRIHDLIHDFCLRKAKHEHFFHHLKGYDELSTFNEPYNLRRLSIHSKPEHFAQSKLFCPRARSLFFHSSEKAKPPNRLINVSFVIDIFKRLRVLDLEQIYLNSELPSEIELLVQLAFVAVRGRFKQVPPLIGKLSYLETFILVSGFDKLSLPASLWNLRNLKNLYIKCPLGGIFPKQSLDSLPVLYELCRLSRVGIFLWDDMEILTRKFPNIRRLGCTFLGHQNPEDSDTIVALDCFSKLESLSIRCFHSELTPRFSWPKGLEKLTLERCVLSVRNISTIGTLLNLKVLKLSYVEFESNAWELKEGEFSKLRILSLQSSRLVKWGACDDQFECLHTLVLRYCSSLEDIPCCLESIVTLETIEVIRCSKTVEYLVRQIEEKQVEHWGNPNLKVHYLMT